jgi:hypothetical protein
LKGPHMTQDELAALDYAAAMIERREDKEPT